MLRMIIYSIYLGHNICSVSHIFNVVDYNIKDVVHNIYVVLNQAAKLAVSATATTRLALSPRCRSQHKHLYSPRASQPKDRHEPVEDRRRNDICSPVDLDVRLDT